VTTTTLPDVDEVLAAHEFDPVCEMINVPTIDLWWWQIQLPWGKRCRRPARWIVTFPCCGSHEFVCDPCRRDYDQIENCGRWWDDWTLTWRRI